MENYNFKSREGFDDTKINIEKIYIEPTNFCNLNCKTCIRNTWKHDLEQLAYEDIEKLVYDLRKIDTLKTVMFSGFGEPLFHKDIIRIIKKVKTLGVKVEIISNGILLTEKMCVDLIEAGLDTLWISIDGASAKNYEEIRVGASQDKLLDNIMLLNKKRILLNSDLELGIAFVAMKDNIKELPEVVELARKLGAKHFKVTNLLPYTEDMVEKTLYNRVLLTEGSDVGNSQLRIDLPAIDLNEDTKDPLYRVIRGMDNIITLMGTDTTRKYDYCKFIKEGCIVIGADGRVAPCLALLYENKTYLHKHQRTIKPMSYGNIKQESIVDIWNNSDYNQFRNKVDKFDFSCCVYCGGCENIDSNEEDCFGNKFPVCGGCLWAQGIIQCP